MALVTFSLADTDAPLVATKVLTVDGCTLLAERNELLTRTSTFGIVYVTAPRKEVNHGSVTAHAATC